MIVAAREPFRSCPCRRITAPGRYPEQRADGPARPVPCPDETGHGHERRVQDRGRQRKTGHRWRYGGLVTSRTGEVRTYAAITGPAQPVLARYLSEAEQVAIAVGPRPPRPGRPALEDPAQRDRQDLGGLGRAARAGPQQDRRARGGAAAPTDGECPTSSCVVSTGHSCFSTAQTGSDTDAYDEDDNRIQVAESNGATSSDYCPASGFLGHRVRHTLEDLPVAKETPWAASRSTPPTRSSRSSCRCSRASGPSPTSPAGCR